MNIVKCSIVKPINFRASSRAFQKVWCHYSQKFSMRETISLNETETRVRNLLMEFCCQFNSRNQVSEPIELRITGGWVRDKLLGKESHDLDVAINTLSGEEFASHLVEYLAMNRPEISFKGNTIRKNPEKSKHLETCTAKLYGLDIDFVNLRSEKYSTDSRVPQIECGTAEEDALRRDATLNALFYNLNKQEIEDFTGKGLEDLKNGILRTPLPPLQTFLDDPLRVLRLIRFASRFDFAIDSETLQAMKNPEIKSTLVHKISRERVGDELAKTLASDNPEYGLRLISFLNLTDSIFNAGPFNRVIEENSPGTVVKEVHARQEAMVHRCASAVHYASAFLATIESSLNPHLQQIYLVVANNKQLTKLFWLAVILQPFGSLAVKTAPKKAVKNYMAEIVLKEGLRFGKNEFDVVATLVSESEVSRPLLESFFTDPSLISRSTMGFYMRKFVHNWQLNILFNCYCNVLDALPAIDSTTINASNPAIHASSTETQKIPIENPQVTSILTNYNHLLNYISNQNLQSAHTLKPLIDGRSLALALNMNPGPWMSKINAEILSWQLENPSGDKKQCLDYVKSIIANYT